jgi:formate hydrogenlyase subunit 3/multisubunit Na+/H+ antiporter MnhD subunit
VILHLYLAAILLLAAGAAAALLLARRPAAALAAGSLTAAAGSALGLVASFAALRAPPSLLALPWKVPNGLFAVGLDPLSAAFAVALFAVGLAAGIFGAGYMRAHLRRRSLPAFVSLLNLLLASMALVLAARQAVLFLVAWEVMTVASFLLVAFDHADAGVRRAARTYLVASHLGAAFVFALFLLLARAAGSFRFEAFAAPSLGAGAPASVLFALALAGFGTKAGLVPLHVWLPEAHPAAPSHVSALMSAVLVKMGVYGLLRVLGFLPPAPLAWGLVLAGLGLVGAVAALLLALGQRDLKRVLAYSTVENVALVVLGLGIGLAGAALRSPPVAALGVAAALLHVWSHALMKGLAFLGAGALVHGAGTRDLERMGGLLGRMPATGAALLLASVALAALPPLNGFFSEWLLYLGLLRAGAASSPSLSLAAWLAFAALAFLGALAAIVFARLVGVALLGSPRSAGAAAAHEGGPLLVAPLALLASANVAIALLPSETLRLLAPAAAAVLRVSPAEVEAALAPAIGSLAGPMRVLLVLLVVVGAAVALLARRAVRRRGAATSSTWGCGFSAESPRVQYGAASFAEAVLAAAAPRVLRPRADVTRPAGLFPRAGRFAQDGDDPARARLFEPLFARVGDLFSRLRGFQQARLNLQLLYTVLTVLALSALLLLHERAG